MRQLIQIKTAVAPPPLDEPAAEEAAAPAEAMEPAAERRRRKSLDLKAALEHADAEEAAEAEAPASAEPAAESAAEASADSAAPEEQQAVVSRLREQQADKPGQEELSALHRTHSQMVHEGLVLESFLETSRSQLTVYGISELHRLRDEGSCCVFFRNNHFSVLHKHKGCLFVLVTDEGYSYQKHIVWEQLMEVEGDTEFFTGRFMRHVPGAPPPADEHSDTSGDAAMAKKLQQDYENEVAALRAQQERARLDEARRREHDARAQRQREMQKREQAERERKERERKKKKEKSDSCVVS